MIKETNVTFAKRLKSLMDSRGYKTAIQLADEVLVSHVAMGNYLKGRIPKSEELFRIAKALGVTMEFLLNGTSEPTSGAHVLMETSVGNVEINEALSDLTEIKERVYALEQKLKKTQKGK